MMLPPRDNLVRASAGGFELRANDEAMPTIFGHGAVFNQWTKIDSAYEGRFMERIAPGAFRKTIAENRSNMRMLFNHGKDPQIGDKPVAPIETLEEDATGLAYSGRMLDTSYNRDLIPGLQAGLYGSSFRFRVVKEDFNQRAKVSEFNPDGLPERTIQEAMVMEFGPVTFPAYPQAGAGVRSMTDAFVLAQLAADPERLAQLVASLAPENRNLDDLATYLFADKAALQAAIDKLNAGEPLLLQEAELLEAAIEHLEPPNAMIADEADEMNSAPKSGAERSAHSAEPATATPRVEPVKEIPKPKEPTVADLLPDERAARMTELESAIKGVTERFTGKLPTEIQVSYYHDTAELEDLRSDERAYQERRNTLARLVESGSGRTERPFEAPAVIKKPENIYGEPAFDDIEKRSRNTTERNSLRRDFAMRGLEQATFPRPDTDVERSKDRIAHLLDEVDEPTPSNPDRELSRRIIATGSPVYKRAFNKLLVNNGNVAMLTQEEQRGTALAMGVTTTGGFLVPYGFDPTIIAIGAHTTINPYRRTCRTVDIVGTNIWHALTSTAAVATRTTEAAAAIESGPTLAQPSYQPVRIQTQITYSIEAAQDRPSLAADLGVLIGEAKDNEEENIFSVGALSTTSIGMGAPYGTSGAYTGYETVGSVTLAVADLYGVEAALPIRHRANAQWYMSRSTIRYAQTLETTSGILFNAIQNFGSGAAYAAVGNPAQDAYGNTGLKLLGYPVNEAPSMQSAKTSHYTFATLANPETFVIVDRVGMEVEFIPFIFGAGQGNLVTGQRALYAIWRNVAMPINVDGGRMMDYKT